MLDQTLILGGYDTQLGNIRLREQTEAALVSLAIPLGGEDAARKAIASAFKLDLPPVGQSVASDAHRLIRTAPDQALLRFDDPSPLAEPAVQASLKGTCYTTNQTDAWVILSIDGPAVRDVLERLCPLDLHPDAFAIDTAQRTTMEHMGAIIARIGPDTFELMSASSSARSFLHALETSILYAG